jgi:hypothetical protein
MSDASYRVIHHDGGGVSVEVVRPGALPQVATGFASEADATEWIVQDRRLSRAADPFRTPVSRRRWGGA